MTRFRPYPSYKESGVEWPGKIPQGWDTKRAKFVFRRMSRPVGPDDDIVTAFRDGTVTLRTNRRTGGFTNAAKEIGYQGVRCGDLVIHAMDGFAGAVGVSDSDGKSSPVYAVCTPTNQQDTFTRYYGYAVRFMATSGYVSSLAKGIRERSTEFRFVEFGETPIPTLAQSEQRAIAAFLDRETHRIDTLVEKKERLVELMKEKRTALISHAVTKGLDPNVRMKDSGVEWLGKIPEHWQMKKLKHLALDAPGAIKTGPFGSQLKSEEMRGGDTKVYNQRTVIDRDASLGENYISPDKFRELADFAVGPGDILLTTRGTIGKCYRLPPNAEPGILHPCLMRIRPDSAKYNPKLLVRLIEDSDLAQTQLFRLSDATTIDVIYSQTMRRLTIPTPPADEQEMIVEFLDRETRRNDAMVEKVKRSMELLKEYRTALISAAVTGKIDVREKAA